MKTFRNQKHYLEDRIQTNRSANRKQYKTNMRKESVYTTNLIACKRIMITNKSGKPLYQKYMIIWNYKSITDECTISKKTTNKFDNNKYYQKLPHFYVMTKWMMNLTTFLS